jgi:hypothetical protein
VIYPSQGRILDYVNGALLGAYDEAIRQGYTDGQAGDLLSVPFDNGYALIQTITEEAHEFCWDLDVPGNAMGDWILDGGPLYSITVQGTEVTAFRLLDFFNRLNVLNPASTTLGQQCRTYFARIDTETDKFSMSLTEIATPAWREVWQAAAAEAKARGASSAWSTPWSEIPIPTPLKWLIGALLAREILGLARRG